jgi:cysteine synthase A
MGGITSDSSISSGICEGFSAAVGHTPLIRLRALSELTGCDILGKAEFMNPGGSVKDRAALGILQEAERSGELRPGGTVVEGTAGNTGIGLAHLCNARGYRCLIVIPDTQSAEKIGLLRSLGAEVRTVPAVPYANPDNYVRLSGRIAAEIPGALWANQFDNLANRRAHYASTGPEIWHQCGGKVPGWRPPAPAAPMPVWPCTSRSGTRGCAACWPIPTAAPCTAGPAPANSTLRAARSLRGSATAA